MQANENHGRRWQRSYPMTILLMVAAVVAVNWTTSSSSAAAYSSALRRYPYISEVVGNSATLNWGTDRSQTTGGATWGAVSNGSCTPSNNVTPTRVGITVGTTSEYQWSAALAFPGPGTYCYRVQLGSTDLLAEGICAVVSAAQLEQGDPPQEPHHRLLGRV